VIIAWVILGSRGSFLPAMSSPNGQPPVQKGEILDGKYRVEKLLGMGGMGVVVAARHTELDTYVAIKFLLPEAMQDQENVVRFSREARAMVRLKSPHAARVYDVGKLATGAPYMVMELLLGQDLGEMLEKTGVPLPIWDAVDYVLQACEGIAEAHAFGIIHRDLKPRNIFLTRNPDGKVVVKVLDFGLAKSVTTMGAPDHALTRTTAIMGSPLYMSPEQMRASRDVDTRTDIWSLGVCLYELLTHAAPFEAATIPELCALVLTATPRAPSQLRPEIPDGLCDAVMRCLEKEPAKRFADIGQLAHAIAPYARWTVNSAARVRTILDSPREFPVNLESSRPPAPAPSARTPEARTLTAVDTRVERRRGRSIGTIAALVLFVIGTLGIGFYVSRRGASPAALAPPASASSTAVSSELVLFAPPIPTGPEPAPPATSSAMPPSTSTSSATSSTARLRQAPRPPAPVKAVVPTPTPTEAKSAAPRRV
jgi:eukaryotic-like serine/threonine-protein kinase